MISPMELAVASSSFVDWERGLSWRVRKSKTLTSNSPSACSLSWPSLEPFDVGVTLECSSVWSRWPGFLCYDKRNRDSW